MTKRAFLPEASLISSTRAEGEWCACGAGLFVCEACGDLCCPVCDPYANDCPL